MNRVNGCLYGTHNLWYTDSSVDFWFSQRNKKAKTYILLWCSCFIMACTLSHEPWHPVRYTSHKIYPSIGSKETLLSWSFGSWISHYKCNQYLSPLMLWVWILLVVSSIRSILYSWLITQALETGRKKVGFASDWKLALYIPTT
jgi:hypothetical protein